MACARSSSFAFLDWKYTNKWKEKVQKNAQIPFGRQMKPFRCEIIFREIQPCFLHGGELGLFWTNQGSEVFEELEVHSVLYGQEEFVFKRQFSWTFSTFWLRRARKTTKFARFEIDFMLHYAMCSADVTCLNGSTVQLVLRELLLRINSWVFENKFSRNYLKSSFKPPVRLIYFRPIWGGLNRDRGFI